MTTHSLCILIARPPNRDLELEYLNNYCLHRDVLSILEGHNICDSADILVFDARFASI